MTSQLPDNILRFIKHHHVFVLATASNDQPWVADCFYAFLPSRVALVFTSDIATRHIHEAVLNPKVAGSIVLETRVVGKIQGIQFEGILFKPEGELADEARTTYLLRFPFAALMETTLWVLDLNYIKMTDNRLGFGKKLIWTRSDIQT